MKKILSMFLAIIAVFSLVSCKDKDEDKGGNGGDQTPVVRTYVADGKYSAFSTSLNYGNPQLNWVTVTIKNDKIESFYIDQLQSDSPSQWKAQSKKELGYKYGMHMYAVGDGAYAGGVTDENKDAYAAAIKAAGKLEWFEQAKLIEEHFLTTLDVQVDGSGYIQGISNVTIADNDYIALAKKAVENAKAGIVTTFVPSIYGGSAIIVSANAKINAEGKVTEVKIDELQSSVTEVDGKPVFAWKAESKQQLGYRYGMHMHAVGDGAYAGGVTNENKDAYAAAIKAAGKLEWFEQVDLIAAAWLGGADVSNINTVSGVTIADTAYSAVLAAILSEGWKK